MLGSRFSKTKVRRRGSSLLRHPFDISTPDWDRVSSAVYGARKRLLDAGLRPQDIGIDYDLGDDPSAPLAPPKPKASNLQRALDAISTINYGMAGFARGAINSANGAQRDAGALKEMREGLSHKDKRGFGSALDAAGWKYDKKKPFYSASNLGHLGVGLAADVFLDPTTYLTLGFGGAARAASRIGIKGMDEAVKAGMAARRARGIDPNSVEEFAKIKREALEAVAGGSARAVGGLGPEKMARKALQDKGGIRLGRFNLVPQEVLRRLPGGDKLFTATAGERSHLYKTLTDTNRGEPGSTRQRLAKVLAHTAERFDPDFHLRNLPVDVQASIQMADKLKREGVYVGDLKGAEKAGELSRMLQDLGHEGDAGFEELVARMLDPESKMARDVALNKYFRSTAKLELDDTFDPTALAAQAGVDAADIPMLASATKVGRYLRNHFYNLAESQRRVGILGKDQVRGDYFPQIRSEMAAFHAAGRDGMETQKHLGQTSAGKQRVGVDEHYLPEEVQRMYRPEYGLSHAVAVASRKASTAIQERIYMDTVLRKLADRGLATETRYLPGAEVMDRVKALQKMIDADPTNTALKAKLMEVLEADSAHYGAVGATARRDKNIPSWYPWFPKGEETYKVGEQRAPNFDAPRPDAINDPLVGPSGRAGYMDPLLVKDAVGEYSDWQRLFGNEYHRDLVEGLIQIRKIKGEISRLARASGNGSLPADHPLVQKLKGLQEEWHPDRSPSNADDAFLSNTEESLRVEDEIREAFQLDPSAMIQKFYKGQESALAALRDESRGAVRAFNMPADMVNKLNDLGKIKDRNGLLPIVQGHLNKWKTWATVMNPGYWLRNMQGYYNMGYSMTGDPLAAAKAGGAGRAIWDAIDPKAGVRLLGDKRKQGFEALAAQFERDMGLPRAEARKQAAEYLKFANRSGQRRASFMERENAAATYNQAEKRARKFETGAQWTQPIRKGGRRILDTAQKNMEDIYRLGMTNRLFKEGLTKEEAVLRGDDFFYDYGKSTDFERDVMKTIMPFYSWLRKNPVRQVRNLIENPGRFGNYGDVTNELSQGAEDPEMKWAPQYFRDLTGVPLPNTGLGKSLVWNPNLPLQGLNTDLRDAVGGIHPLIKVLPEIATNYNTFTGRPIEDNPVIGGRHYREAGSAFDLAEGAYGLAGRDLASDFPSLFRYQEPASSLGADAAPALHARGKLTHLVDAINPLVANMGKWLPTSERDWNKLQEVGAEATGDPLSIISDLQKKDPRAFARFASQMLGVTLLGYDPASEYKSLAYTNESALRQLVQEFRKRKMLASLED
jgi:hypothetical protein